MSALGRKLWRDLARQRGHLAAVMLVVACGISVFVMMTGARTALERQRAAYYDAYLFADVFASLRRAPVALLPRLADSPDLAQIQARIVHDVSAQVPGLDDPATLRLVSLPPGQVRAINGIHLRSGRMPADGADDEAVVSEAFAAANRLGPGSSVRAALNGRWQTLHVVGVAISPEFVFETWGAAVFPDSRRYGVAWLPEEALAAAFDMQGAFNNLVVRLAPGGSAARMRAHLDAVLGDYGALGAHDRSLQVSNQMLSDELRQLRVSATVLPIIFLGVAAFLVSNVLTRIVALQRSQIGLLKAFGYPPARVTMHFVEFALVAVMAGSVLGIALGAWLGRELTTLYVEFFHFPSLRFRLDPGLLLAVLAASAATAALGALQAVRRVNRLAPAESMRPPAPAVFRPLLFDRLGISGWLTPGLRMVLRNLERRPLRAASTIFAIGLATALMVVGQSMYDSLDEIIWRQFRMSQREDLDVRFREAVALPAVGSISALPGVLRAEPYRVLPATLRAGPRSRDVAILAYPDGAQMRRVFDRALHLIEVPRDGLALSLRLAEVLGVGPGDAVDVEPVERGRRRRTVRVARLIDDYVGMTALANPALVAGLLEQAPTASGVLLSIDSSQRARLFARLRDMPGVASIEQREATLQSFLDVVARNTQLSIGMMISFAWVIAAGVVYNGARLALSEQSFELSSLRVLGFTRAEVGRMLVGEQAILTLVAIPFGFGFGAALSLWVNRLIESDTFRLPYAVSPSTLGTAAIVVLGAAVVSAGLVLWRLRDLDLVEALKSRE